MESFTVQGREVVLWEASGDKKSDWDNDDQRGGSSTVIDPKATTKTKKPKLYKVILHNDNYTTMEFVVHVLQNIFHKNHAEATHLMLYVHMKGQAVIGLYTFDIAETKVKQVLELAREQGYPLLCTMEPE